MKLQHARILLTGATGGLGSELAKQLTEAGATLLLAGRNAERLTALQTSLGGRTAVVGADLTQADGIATVAHAAREFGANVLINNAGASLFGLLENQEWAAIEQVLATSLEAPIRLTHALLPWLKAQPEAVVVNIGSTFGSLPFAGFAAYSAAKAGLRGFSQALRRELADTRVAVVHIAPRSIDTPMNSAAVTALNRALNSQSDSAADVACEIVTALVRNDRELHIGFPERFFAWLNGIAPGLIDRSLAGKLPIIKQHAAGR
ncbi:SDR family oxidoreductase [Propionivibrio limicola]|uniref:SDR family oxidoreductase n=1 Tax=Propionivibrio limicola TaxID=167645 RepID=UPI0012914ED1|nr:SDR family oxidoreductase [Propionivibrio limicola]